MPETRNATCQFIPFNPFSPAGMLFRVTHRAHHSRFFAPQCCPPGLLMVELANLLGSRISYGAQSLPYSSLTHKFCKPSVVWPGGQHLSDWQKGGDRPMAVYTIIRVYQ